MQMLTSQILQHLDIHLKMNDQLEVYTSIHTAKNSKAAKTNIWILSQQRKSAGLGHCTKTFERNKFKQMSYIFCNFCNIN